VGGLLGLLYEISYEVFYEWPAADAQLCYEVRAMKAVLKKAIGDRLHQFGENDIVLAALGLHPMYKCIVPPPTLRQELFAEHNGKNIMSFYRDLRPRCVTAMARLMEQLNIAQVQEAPLPLNPAAAKRAKLFQGAPKAAPNARASSHQEVIKWLEHPYHDLGDETLLQFWARMGDAFPLMQQLARCVLVCSASAAASERNWSLADQLSGGDRASVSPETLAAQMMLKKNVPVRAQIEAIRSGHKGVGLFDAF